MVKRRDPNENNPNKRTEEDEFTPESPFNPEGIDDRTRRVTEIDHPPEVISQSERSLYTQIIAILAVIIVAIFLIILFVYFIRTPTPTNITPIGVPATVQPSTTTVTVPQGTSVTVPPGATVNTPAGATIATPPGTAVTVPAGSTVNTPPPTQQ